MSCRRVLSSTPLLVRGSETSGDSIGFNINHVIARKFAIGIEVLNSLCLEGCVLIQLLFKFIFCGI
jgi:hypothetical protein